MIELTTETLQPVIIWHKKEHNPYHIPQLSFILKLMVLKEVQRRNGVDDEMQISRRIQIVVPSNWLRVLRGVRTSRYSNSYWIPSDSSICDWTQFQGKSKER